MCGFVWVVLSVGALVEFALLVVVVLERIRGDNRRVAGVSRAGLRLMLCGEAFSILRAALYGSLSVECGPAWVGGMQVSGRALCSESVVSVLEGGSWAGIWWVIPFVGDSLMRGVYEIVWSSMGEQCSVCVHTRYWCL